MSISRVFFILFLTAIIIPAYLILRGLFEVDWDIAVAISSLLEFLRTVFGKIILSWLLISGISLAIFVSFEAMVRRDHYLFWTLPIILFFGIGAALPFYLFLRLPRRD